MRRGRTPARLAGKAAIGRLTRRALYRLAASERVGRALRENAAVRGGALRAAGPYLGGTTLDGAESTVKRLEAEGFAVGVDYFGEAVTDASVVERKVGEYVRLAEALDGLPADVRSADARDLLARGYRVRLYVPYGEDWPRYWLRRLGERQAS